MNPWYGVHFCGLFSRLVVIEFFVSPVVAQHEFHISTGFPIGKSLDEFLFIQGSESLFPAIDRPSPGIIGGQCLGQAVLAVGLIGGILAVTGNLPAALYLARRVAGKLSPNFSLGS